MIDDERLMDRVHRHWSGDTPDDLAVMRCPRAGCLYEEYALKNDQDGIRRLLRVAQDHTKHGEE